MLIQQGLMVTQDLPLDKDSLNNGQESGGLSFLDLVSDLQSINSAQLESEKEDAQSDAIHSNAEFLAVLPLPLQWNPEKFLNENEELVPFEEEGALNGISLLGTGNYRLQFLNAGSINNTEDQDLLLADPNDALVEHTTAENNNHNLQLINKTNGFSTDIDLKSIPVVNVDMSEKNVTFVKPDTPFLMESDKAFNSGIDIQDISGAEEPSLEGDSDINKSRHFFKDSTQETTPANHIENPSSDISLFKETKGQKERGNELPENKVDNTKIDQFEQIDHWKEEIGHKLSHSPERAIEAYSPSKNGVTQGAKDRIPVWDMTVDSGALDQTSNKATLRINQWGLGEITAKIEVIHHKSVVTLIAETTEAKQALQTHLTELKEFFSDSDLMLGQVNIEQHSPQDKKQQSAEEQQKHTNYKLPENQLKKISLEVTSQRKHSLLDTYV